MRLAGFPLRRPCCRLTRCRPLPFPLPLGRPLWGALGGSAIQRDVFETTLAHAAMRVPGGRRLRLSAALLSERATLQPQSPAAWGAYAACLHASGDARGAADARNRAYVLGLGQGPRY